MNGSLFLNRLPVPQTPNMQCIQTKLGVPVIRQMQVSCVYQLDINVAYDNLSLGGMSKGARESMQSLIKKPALVSKRDLFDAAMVMHTWDIQVEHKVYSSFMVSRTHRLDLLMLRSGRVTLLYRGAMESKS